LLYPAELAERVRPLIKMEDKVRSLGLQAVPAPGKRSHIKNKSLFPLMKEREVVFFVLLEGEKVRGVISDFSRYEITVTLKGGLPVTLLRHSVHDLRNKRGRCFLKSFQETHRDWEKSPLFVSSTAV
jgi:sRNA-binding regulator protein Hfq